MDDMDDHGTMEKSCIVNDHRSAHGRSEMVLALNRTHDFVSFITVISLYPFDMTHMTVLDDVPSACTVFKMLLGHCRGIKV